MNMIMSCPQCQRIIVDRQEDGLFRIRARLVLVPGSGEVIKALCPQCKRMIDLPLKLQHVPNDDGRASEAYRA